jgi:GNAT superfamily N-acetyltransferase
MEIRFAEWRDLDGIALIDKHISRKTLEKIIGDGRIIVAVKGGEVVACLRYNLFWDLIPFMNFIAVIELERNKGLGAELLAFYEERLKEKGYKNCLTSTMSDEQAQRFYRKNGYKDIGGFVLPNEPLEIVLYKEI